MICHGHVCYAAAQNQLAKNLACEWAPDGIRVNAVAPYWILTDLTSGAWKNEESKRMIEKRTPARRIGKPEEVSGGI